MNQTDATIVYSVTNSSQKPDPEAGTNLGEANATINLEIYNPSFEEFTGIKIQSPHFDQNPNVNSPIFTLKDIKGPRVENDFEVETV